MNVLRFTRYYLDSGGERPMVDTGEELWGVATGYGEFDVLPEATSGEVLERFADGACRLTNFCIEEEEDEYEIVPPDDWPDEVCVAVATLALLGEAS